MGRLQLALEARSISLVAVGRRCQAPQPCDLVGQGGCLGVRVSNLGSAEDHIDEGSIAEWFRKPAHEPATPAPRCPVCGAGLARDATRINMHIDACLKQHAQPPDQRPGKRQRTIGEMFGFKGA